MAKELDPKDPTPFFYDAIKKQTENRPVEALQDLQKAIELNDNRAVYRSKLLLDSDVAARSAAQGRIYRDLGFEQLALVEGWKSVNTDPADYSGHRLLADSYSALPRHEIARVSELLQSQLLQPLNLTPVQPSLAESNLLILEGAGPSAAAFNEFNPLFTRNRLAFQESITAGSNETFGDEVVLAGIRDNLSFSLGQFHYDTDGFRPNNNLNQNVYNVFAQAAVTPDLSVQTEYRYRDLNHGDLFFNGDLSAFDQFLKRELTTDTFRFGMRFAPTTNSNLILSFYYLNSLQNIIQSLDSTTRSTTKKNQGGYVGEGQYGFRHEFFDLILGGGIRDVSSDLSERFLDKLNKVTYNIGHSNTYLYSHIRPFQNLTLTLGLSFDSLRDRFFGDYDQVNPKLGLLWELTQDTTVRLAAFRTFTTGIEEEATIEPTQVAGFNQFFDARPATDARRYGVGLDHKLSSNLLIGLEASLRDLIQPIPEEVALDAPIFKSKRDEEFYRAYGYWAINDTFTTNLEYQYDLFSIDNFSIYRNHIIPITISYFHPSMVSASTTMTYVNQEVFEGQQNNDFALVDFLFQYRLPHSFGTASFTIKNILDNNFNFLGHNAFGFRTGRLEETPLYVPERTIFFQLTLSF
jgi:hypothetical protein